MAGSALKLNVLSHRKKKNKSTRESSETPKNDFQKRVQTKKSSLGPNCFFRHIPELFFS